VRRPIEEDAVTERARVRINLAQRELEIEGSETFLATYADRLEAMLNGLFVVEPTVPQTSAAPAAEPAGNDLGSFGEYLLRLPTSATEVDKMLTAGFWVQQQAADDAFATAEANRRLVEQGIKIGNPSQCVKQSVLARRAFAVQRGRFRVSQIGRQHLRQLLGPAVPE
jgi:hypothetical protein